MLGQTFSSNIDIVEILSFKHPLDHFKATNHSIENNKNSISCYLDAIYHLRKLEQNSLDESQQFAGVRLPNVQDFSVFDSLDVVFN